MLRIDGSHGEGGGQILRTSLALSAILARPVTIHNIRANRRKPGLRPQHLTGVQAMANLCQADVTGARLGSSEITFIPGVLPSGKHTIDIGTAGSTSLLLHALYYPMTWSPTGGSLDLLGGTHNDMAPTFHYLQQVWLPWIQLCGYTCSLQLQRYGFYPKGGGEITATIPPHSQTTPEATDTSESTEASGSLKSTEATGSSEPHAGFSWLQRPPLDRIEIHALFGQPADQQKRTDIPERMARTAAKFLDKQGYDAEIISEVVPSFSPGAVCHIICHFGPLRAGFTVFGERGRTSESVGKEVARQALDFLKTEACLDHHMADQVLLPLALSQRPAMYTTTELTGHIETNAEIIQMFLPHLSIQFDEQEHCVQVNIR